MNESFCVEWDVKLYVTHSLTCGLVPRDQDHVPSTVCNFLYLYLPKSYQCISLFKLNSTSGWGDVLEKHLLICTEYTDAYKSYI